jgi:hypothetical protein
MYCMQPSGFVDSAHPYHVCRLNRSLYRLKQAPHVGARSDTSLLVYQHGSETTYLLLYVDDIILTMSSNSMLRQVIDALTIEFSMKDLGTLHHFLGVSVT